MNKLFESIYSVEIGKKAENLQKLVKIQNEHIYKVPYYIPITIGDDTKRIKKEFEKRNIFLVSVRSSSNTEDTNHDSKAGAFKTFINVNINDIDKYINEIQKHALDKFGYKVPIIIQEMVEGISGVAFSTDPDTGKDYTTLNYHNGVGEDLVSGNITGSNVKIFNGADIHNISDGLHKKLFEVISFLKDNLDYHDLDIEFVFDGNTLFLLQVRPITKINGGKKETSKLISRYANYISSLISRKEMVLGDMIDINPEELVGNQPILIKTFFGEIFPKASLKQARLDFGYKDTQDFYLMLGDKVYVDLEKNIRTFLPQSLTEEEVQIFTHYYKKLIISHPDLQNQLDSILYPNNINKVIEVLEQMGVNQEETQCVMNKFNVFFDELAKKMQQYSTQYKNIESNLLSKVGVSNFYELLFINNYKGDISELIAIIKESTYYFSIFARIFFFSSNRGDTENHNYFTNNMYQSQILENLKRSGEEKINYQLPEGFNFMSLMNQTFSLKDWDINNTQDEGTVGMIDIGKVARENLKFLFMNLFRILGLKLQEELNKSFFILEDIGFLKFEDVIAFLEGKKTQNNVDILVRKGKIKKQVSSLLENPSVFTPVNSFIESTQIGNNGFYSGKGILNGEICIINKMSDFENKDYKGKIIIIENATPEIDIYLKNIKGIITKNGGPLSHIMIRARELLIPAVVGTSKYEEIIKINPKNLEICFEAKEIIF